MRSRNRKGTTACAPPARRSGAPSARAHLNPRNMQRSRNSASWAASRTEDIYKLYAESFNGEQHLRYGTTVSYRDSAAASTTFTVLQGASGRPGGHQPLSLHRPGAEADTAAGGLHVARNRHRRRACRHADPDRFRGQDEIALTPCTATRAGAPIRGRRSFRRRAAVRSGRSRRSVCRSRRATTSR